MYNRLPWGARRTSTSWNNKQLKRNARQYSTLNFKSFCHFWKNLLLGFPCLASWLANILLSLSRAPFSNSSWNSEPPCPPQLSGKLQRHKPPSSSHCCPSPALPFLKSGVGWWRGRCVGRGNWEKERKRERNVDPKRVIFTEWFILNDKCTLWFVP